MGKYYKMPKDLKSSIEDKLRQRARDLAVEAKDRLIQHYQTLIDVYYVDYKPTTYKRTYNMTKSYAPYYINSHGNKFVGGIVIAPTESKMSDYVNRKGYVFEAKALMDQYIYNESGTWHGGDWYGGKGSQFKYNIYKEMHNYKDQLIKEFQKRAIIKLQEE